jgi:two-component system sensor histidine kinase/response regulator
MNLKTPEVIHNSLIKASVQKRYIRTLILTYMLCFFISILCTLSFYLYEKKKWNQAQEQETAQKMMRLDDKIDRTHRQLTALTNKLSQSAAKTFHEKDWLHTQLGNLTVLYHKEHIAQLQPNTGMVSTVRWSELKQKKQHLNQSKAFFDALSDISLIDDEIIGIYLLNPVFFSYKIHHGDRAYAVDQVQKIKSKLLHKKASQTDQVGAVWLYESQTQSLILIRPMASSPNSYAAIEIQVSQKLGAVQQHLMHLDFGHIKSIQLEHHDARTHGSVQPSSNRFQTTLADDHPIEPPFKHLRWKFNSDLLQQQEFSSVFLKLCACFLICISILVLLLSFVHRLIYTSFIEPANRLLHHLEACAHHPKTPPNCIPEEWEPWFKLITQIFNQHEKYTIHLSNQNKRLDKIVAQRTQKLKETNLRREREYAQLRALIDSIPDAIFFKDTEGRYLGCNKTAETMLDMRERQIIGVMSTAFMDEQKAKKITLEDQYVLANHTSCRYLNKITVRSKKICLDVSKFPFYDRQGNVLGLIGMWRDVTTQHNADEQLRRSEERFHLAMDAVEDGLWDWYVGSDQITCNPALYKMLGYKPHEFSASRRWMFSLVHPDDAYEHVKKVRYLIKHPRTDYESEFRMRCKDGSYIWILSRGRVVEFTKSGRLKRVVGTNKDISRQKENEVALLEAKKEAEEASLYKSQFLANMSHEIRTPINAVSGLLRLMQTTKLTKQQDDYINKAYNSSHLLLNIINDILDVSKIEAGKLSLECLPFSVHEVLEHAIELTVLPAHQKNIEVILNLNIPDQLICLGDSLRLNQVLINLLANAVKFTETGEIELGCDHQIDNNQIALKFWVQDTGIGLDQKQQKNLFKAFTQADGSMTRRFGGTGLGLSICKHLVQLMGGSITVNSQANQGTTFQFELTFPLVKLERNLPINPSLYGCRVLLIDNNALAVKQYTHDLQSIGFEVASTQHVANSLLKAQTMQPQLLIIDQVMPNVNLDAYLQDLFIHFQHLPQKQRPIIILMQSYTSQINSKVDHAFANIFYITKPFSAYKLKIMLNQWLDAEVSTKIIQQKEPLQKPKSKLLLVEDNIINQQVASELLIASGYDVDIAENGRLALDNIARNSYDLVLMDLQMPVMDGFTATEELRHYFSKNELPIIAMTAHAMESDRQKCQAIGMNDYVTKPFILDQLLHTLEQWLPKEQTEFTSRKNSAILN